MKMIKYWLPKVAVVIVGVIAAMLLMPYVNTAIAKIKTAKQGA